MHEACQGGHVGVLGRLLDYTRDVDVQDKEGVSPVHVAAQNGELQCLDVLHERGMKLLILLKFCSVQHKHKAHLSLLLISFKSSHLLIKFEKL